MKPRVKKLIGAGVLFFGLFLYVFAAAALGEELPNLWYLQAPYYCIAGIAWAFPVRGLMLWMNSEPKEKSQG
ncbi:MAG: DUF2842 domain-containing protein [Pseudomonadota bacterium]